MNHAKPAVATFFNSLLSELKAIDLSCNVRSVERTQRDVRRDEMDRFTLFFIVSGRATVIQNDRVTDFTPGGCALIDIGRPVSYVMANTFGEFAALQLPRKLVISHLGLEPPGGMCWRSNTRAARLLYSLVMDDTEECDGPDPSDGHYMQLAICNLLGALLDSSDLLSHSSHSEKIFKRVCRIVQSHFCDPDFGPRDVASEEGISLRDLQALFTARGTTCSRLIQSLRLEHAATLLRHRKVARSCQPLIEIAFACGFQDYTYFSRAFRHRFGCPPSAFDIDALG